MVEALSSIWSASLDSRLNELQTQPKCVFNKSSNCSHLWTFF